MALDLVFWLSVLAFGWGASLVTYRWFALINGWPMGEWQASRPGLPVTIGIVAIAFALLFALARGGTTGLVVPLLGVLLALAWTALLRVGAQSALLLAPAATVLLVLMWISSYVPATVTPVRRSMGPADQVVGVATTGHAAAGALQRLARRPVA